MPNFIRKDSIVVALLFCFSLGSYAQDFTVVEQIKDSSRRVSRTHMEFTYFVVIENPGPRFDSVNAIVSSTSSNTTIIDADLDFGSVESAAQATSINTFRFRQDRRVPFDPSVFDFTFTTSTSNTIPVADAGPDQTVARGSTVNLDGSASSDGDGDSLSFSWEFLSIPSGSAATLSGEDTVNPQFVADLPGEYQARLIVNDGTADSPESTVLISTGNSAPTADAGGDQTAFVGDVVTFDGSLSSDVDGDPITYSWSVISRPELSSAVLSDASSPFPSIAIDYPGSYEIQLVVNDGFIDSAPDTVIVIADAIANTPPIANAGADQTSFVNNTVVLDGSLSTDADNDPLSFSWSIISQPAQSNAVLSDTSAAQPQFVIDYPGSYLIQLIVNDGTDDSEADTVVITTENSRPVADAGTDQSVHVGEALTLDGSASNDADFDLLSYQWAVTSSPADSLFDFTQDATQSPVLTPDRVGSYLVQLIVSDGQLDSTPDTVVIDSLAPDVNINASATMGSAPMDVSFSAEPVGGIPPFQFSWDLDADGVIDDTRASFVHTFNLEGDYTVQLTMEDSAGHSATASTTISVKSAPVVIASALPDSGPAPLDVALSAIISDADGSIQSYQWDFDGDGTIDYTSTESANVNHQYSSPGLYSARLTVVDNDGLQSSDVVTLLVGIAPEAQASANHFSGEAPFVVEFSGSATDADGSIVLYEWDFDGDKTFDYSSTSSASVTHSYDAGGVFSATLRVTDNDGLIDVYSVVISVSGPPVSLPGAYPLTGSAPLDVTFFSDGTDLDGGPEYYDWDFDGDGTYDRRLIASMNTNYTYTEPGTYQAALKVVDNDGLEGVATVEIVVTGGDEPSDGSPIISVSATPSNGGAPLDVVLSGSAELSDTASASALFEWDFDSDGIFDWSETREPVQLITQLIDVGSYASPFFADFDADGDLDVIIGNSSGQLSYFINSGTAQIAEFTLVGIIEDNNQTVIDVSSYAAPYAYDIDQDSDLDLLVGNSAGRITVIENIGSAQTPIWQNNGLLTLSSGSVVDIGSYATPIVYTIDSDADWDLLVGNSAGQFTVLENTGTLAAPVWESQGLLADADGVTLDVGSYATPFLVDHDNDGDLDLYSGESGGRLVLIENQGDNSAPSYINQSYMADEQSNQIDIGSYSVPRVVNTSGANPDLWLGNSSGQLGLYTSSINTPLNWVLSTLAFNQIDVGSYAAPALVDYDGDADRDLLIGNSAGNIRLVRNLGDDNNPIWRQGALLNDSNDALIDIGSYAAPALFDLDNDGDQDMVVGNSSGQLAYFNNTGSVSAPQWQLVGPLVNPAGATIDIGSYAHPLFYDVDADGDVDLYVGDSIGRIWFIENTGDNSLPVWTSNGPLVDADNNTIDIGSYAAPVIGDFNGDQIVELVVGNSAGLLTQFVNVGSAAQFNWLQIDDRLGDFDFGSYAAPVALNIDNDVDQDFLVGNSGGLVYAMLNRGNVSHTYEFEGNYSATLRVTDSNGLSSQKPVSITVLPTGFPSLEVEASVTQGNIPLTVNFNAYTQDDGSVVSYEWDFDGDGSIDRTGNANEIFTFNSVGVFNPTVRVTDDDGNRVVVTLSITTGMDIAATRTTSINPSAGEQSAITTVLPAAANVTLQVIDELGNVIKTLVNNEARDAGSYTDSWDGNDDLNNLVRDGVYYFVIRYSSNGVEQVIDTRSTADYAEYTPGRTWPSSFNPYKGIPVTSTYTVSRPAEVTFYLWTRDRTRPGSTIAPVRTLFVREPRAAGTYTDIWDGVDDNGVPVEPGRQYPITLWVYELADNAIIVTGAKPALSDLSVENRVFNPAFNPYSENQSSQNTRVNFSVSKDASVEVVVIDHTGQQIGRFTKAELTAGTNSINWDGRNFDEKLVPQGVYSLQLTAIDSQGNRSLPRYAVVTVRY